eukprot:gene23845-32232_t
MELAHCSLFNILHNKEKFADMASNTTLSNLALCTDIANGMCYLHFHHIQHRDLKTANVLIFRDVERQNRMTAKISDFGIASVVGSTSTGTAGINAGGGTLAYMAPELLGIVDDDDDDDDGNGDSGHTVMESSTSFSYSSDIYAAGIVFNEIWTCTVPWSNLTHYSLVAHRVAKGKRPVLYVPQRDSVNEQELMNLIGSASTGCLSQNPFHRPAAALVYQELSRLLENEQHREEEDSLSIADGLSFTRYYSRKVSFEKVALSPSSSASEMHDIVYADSDPRPPPIVVKNAPQESIVFEEIRFDGMKIGQESATSPAPCIHYGKMECNCGHALGCVPFPLDTTYFHSDNCKWLCCSRVWSEEVCVKLSQPQHSLSPDLGPLDHPGLMVCECLHKLGRVSFPLDMSYFHSDDCKWNCCNLEWHESSCSANRKFGSDLVQENSHHKGLMACNCSHYLGRVPFPLKAGQAHLDGSCKWLCCDLDYLPIEWPSSRSLDECKWTCCNLDWSEDMCPSSVDSSIQPSLPVKSDPFKWCLQMAVLCCGLNWSADICPTSIAESSTVVKVESVKSAPIQSGHHQGLLVCKCAHDLGKVPFPLKISQHHLDDICKWTYCELDWNTESCSGIADSSTQPSSYMKAAPVRIPQGTSGASPGPCTHRGMMECNCGHRLGRVPFPLDSAKYFHSNDCKWLCCNRVWSKDECPNSADTSPSPPVKAGQTEAGHPNHQGLLVCQCAHDLGKVPFPLDKSCHHLDDICKWTCCELDWNAETCPKKAGFGFSTRPQFAHSGLMACKCIYRLGNVPFPLKKNKVHENGCCKWLCCNQNWSEDMCPSSVDSSIQPSLPVKSAPDHYHSGLMACNCGYQLGRVPFPLKADKIHLNGVCKWLCCDLNWSEDICPTSSTDPSTHMKAAPIRIPQGTSGASPGPCTHRGMMECNCGHRLGRVPFPLDSAKYFHLNDCKWLCCNRVWSKEECPNSADTSPSPHLAN